MSIRDLSKPQWDAVREAADQFMDCNAARAEDRAAFRVAKAKAAALIPNGDIRELIVEAVRWRALNDLAETFAGWPRPIRVETHIQLAGEGA
jgi:hypothetical protein